MTTKRIQENVELGKPARKRFVNRDESNVWPGVGNRSVSGAMRNAELVRFASECRAKRGMCPIQVSGFRFHASAFLLCLLLIPLCARAAGDPSLFPDGRQKMELPSSERNPFIQQIAPEAPTTAPQEGTSEEARLRRLLRAMKIGAVSGAPGKMQVLLGSLILKPGSTLPSILKNQFEVLRVLSVDDTSVVLAFVERDKSAAARQIILPYDIKPHVTQVMFGEAFEKLAQVGPNGKIDAPPLTMQGVEEFLSGSREADLRNMADRDVQMMGVVTNADNSKKDK